MNVQRYDFSQIQAKIDDDGFLHDSPIVGRIGIQEYRNADGSIRRELRLPEEVFKADALESMRGKPITVDHPKSGRVTAKDATRTTVGTMLAAGRQDGDTVRTDIVIHAPQAMGDRRQLSLGYTCNLDMTAGEHPIYGRYDAIQRDITINHLSVVPSARAGAIARLNLDGNEEEFFTPQEQHTMTERVTLDNGIAYDAAPEVARELLKLRGDAADAVKKLDAAQNEATKLQARVDAQQAEIDGFAAKLDAAREEGKQAAAARAKLEKVAEGFKVDCADMTDRQIKEAVIKSVRKDADLSEKSDVYVDAAFDMALEVKAQHADAAQRIKVNADPSAEKQEKTDAHDEYMANLGRKD